VDDQDKALRFYTEVLGFVKKTDVPLGEYRWLTVVSPDDPEGTELLLEPDAHPAAKPFKRALVEDGIPAAQLAELSMGMSHDFEAAIAEGATIVRVGSAIFGARAKPA